MPARKRPPGVLAPAAAKQKGSESGMIPTWSAGVDIGPATVGAWSGHRPRARLCGYDRGPPNVPHAVRACLTAGDWKSSPGGSAK
jgi:hypothetical protein